MIDKVIGLLTVVGAVIASAIQFKRNRDAEVEMRERIVRLETSLFYMAQQLEELKETDETEETDESETCESTSQT